MSLTIFKVQYLTLSVTFGVNRLNAWQRHISVQENLWFLELHLVENVQIWSSECVSQTALHFILHHILTCLSFSFLNITLINYYLRIIQIKHGAKKAGFWLEPLHLPHPEQFHATVLKLLFDRTLTSLQQVCPWWLCPVGRSSSRNFGPLDRLTNCHPSQPPTRKISYLGGDLGPPVNLRLAPPSSSTRNFLL